MVYPLVLEEEEGQQILSGGYDHWLTDPENVLPLIRQTLGTINLDPASNRVAQQYVKAEEFYGLDVGRDALDLPWYGNVFCNPPYSRGNIDAFVERALYFWLQGSIENMLFLVNSQTDTEWYHTLLGNASSALLWRGRIKFWKIDLEAGEAYKKWPSTTGKRKGMLTNSPRYLNTLFYFGKNKNHFVDVFWEKGTFISIW